MARGFSVHYRRISGINNALTYAWLLPADPLTELDETTHLARVLSRNLIGFQIYGFGQLFEAPSYFDKL